MKKLATLGLLMLSGPLAFAQASASATGTANAKIIVPVTITPSTSVVNAAAGVLNFGTIVPSASAGTVSVNVANNLTITRSNTGGATPVTSSVFTGAGWTLGGDPNASINVTLPASATLTSGANNMTVNGFHHGPTSVTLNGSGAADLVVGGTLNVGANQAAGSYTGTFTVTVSYN